MCSLPPAWACITGKDWGRRTVFSHTKHTELSGGRRALQLEHAAICTGGLEEVGGSGAFLEPQ